MPQQISSSPTLENNKKNLGPSSTLLVVEDHDVYRGVVCAAMARHLPGFETQEAGSVSSALEILRSHEVDVMVVDMTLPDGSAIDLVERAGDFIRQGLKVIVFSSHSSEDMLPVLSRDDVHGYVSKEAGMKALAEAVSKTF